MLLYLANFWGFLQALVPAVENENASLRKRRAKITRLKRTYRLFICSPLGKNTNINETRDFSTIRAIRVQHTQEYDGIQYNRLYSCIF